MTRATYVIPSHNCVEWLSHSVASVQKQNYPADQIEGIIIDDGSRDSTGQYLDWLLKEDKRFRVIAHPEPQGRSVSRNQGNVMAAGEIIFVLDADDVAYPNRTKLTVEKFKKGVDLVYGGAEVMGPLGDKRGIFVPDVFNRDKALERMENRIVHSTVAYTKAFALQFPYRAGEISDLGIDDWTQQIEGALAGAVYDFVPQSVAWYRVLSSGISNTRDPQKVKEAKLRFLDSLKVPA